MAFLKAVPYKLELRDSLDHDMVGEYEVILEFCAERRS